jgi:phosphatidylethanolamine/phosphatidyl-N-methylethanolamine N-methyltransferase
MSSKNNEGLFFLKKLIKNPKAVGAVAPSSQSLGEFMSRYVDFNSDAHIVELGAGTGSLTKALIKAGANPEKLILLEIDDDMCRMLREKFPKSQVIQGYASNLHNLINQDLHGTIPNIISGIPMVNLNFDEKQAIMKSVEIVLKPQGKFLQFTYGPVSPLPAAKLGLTQKRLGHVLLNMPPAMVWCYTFGAVPQPERLKTLSRARSHIMRLVAQQKQKMKKGVVND